MFSEGSGSMHEVLFGGISLQTMNTQTMQTETDENFPFINDITSVVVDSTGKYSQHWIGEFPVLNDTEQKRLRFGANAEFFLEGIQDSTMRHRPDELTQPTVLRHIFGGLIANGPTPAAATPGNSLGVEFFHGHTRLRPTRDRLLALVAGLSLLPAVTDAAIVPACDWFSL
jgi:hypothetical protein